MMNLRNSMWEVLTITEETSSPINYFSSEHYESNVSTKMYKDQYYISTTDLINELMRLTTKKTLLNASLNHSTTEYADMDQIDLQTTVDDGNSKLGDFEEKLFTSIFAILIVLGRFDLKLDCYPNMLLFNNFLFNY